MSSSLPASPLSIRSPWSLAALLHLGLLLGAGAASAAETRDLLAHGSSQISDRINPIWAAMVNGKSPQEETTTILMRSNVADPTWQELYSVHGRVMAVTSHSGELVVVLSRREWAWVSESRYTVGPRLPGRADILAMAGDEKTLWALGRPEGGPATAPSTGPSVGSPRLYRLSGETWSERPAPWPVNADVLPFREVSMAIIRQQPVVAVVDDKTQDKGIRVIEFADGAWREVGRPAFANGPGRSFKLLSRHNKPALWLQTESGAQIWTADNSFPLTLPNPRPRLQDMDLAVAGDQFFLLFRRDGKLLEQRYTLGGTPEGQSVQLDIETHSGPRIEWLTVGVMAVLSILILNALLRRRAAAKRAEEEDRSDPDE